MHLKEVIPLLWVSNLETTVQFYTATLGFELSGLVPGAWALVRAGDAAVMFALPGRDMHFEKAVFTGSLYFYPEDLEAVWLALKDKVMVDYPIADFNYGMREFGIRDNNGYLLQFGALLTTDD
jgi:uncharacterized glyoxalase superfamily protein PhnB